MPSVTTTSHASSASGNEASQSQMRGAFTTAIFRRVDRGLSQVIWGLLLTCLCMLGVIQIPLLARFAFPVALLPMLMLLWGLWRLHQIPLDASRWARISTWALWAGVFVLYFIPILAWWSAHLGSYFFALNALAASIVLVAFIALLNLIPAELARLRPENVAYRELVFSAWFAGAMLTFIFGVVASFAAFSFLSGRGLPFKELFQNAPHWHIRAMLCLPVALTLVSLVKGRLTLRLLANSDLR